MIIRYRNDGNRISNFKESLSEVGHREVPSGSSPLYPSGKLSFLFEDKTMKWFRFYTEVRDDVKMLQLSDYEYRMFTYLLCHASEVNSTSGECRCDVTSLSVQCRTRVSHLKKAIETFQKLGLVSINGDGIIKITNWSKRQFKSDDSYSRVKKYREVTAQRNVSNPVSETLPDTDTDTDKQKKKYNIVWDAEKKDFSGITKDDVNGWFEAFPALDIQDQLLRAREWVRANPKNVKSNWRRFFVNWFTRAQDRARI